jgi:replicative DNA helicase
MTWLPHNPEAESGLLGVCLLAPNIIGRLVSDYDIDADDFHTPICRQIWDVIYRLHANHQGIDTVTVAALLGTPRAQEQVTDMLLAASPTGAIKQHALILKDMSRRRGWHYAGAALSEAAATGEESLVARAEKHLAAPTVSDDSTTAVDVGMAVCDFLAASGQVGVSTGYPALDNRLGGGLRPGDSTALAAWPAMGKSVITNNILSHATLEGRRAHLYINEMSVVDVGLRQVARMSGIKHSRLVVRDLTQDEHARAQDAASRLPFGITDCSMWTADQIGRHIRAHRWDVCALDLLHNMTYDGEGELHQMVATLAAAARSAGTHLIIVCQLNDKRAVADVLPMPVIRDIRGSGMIKAICANVLLLHREQKNDHGVVFTQLDGLVNAAKARHGQQGSVPLRFEPESMRFVAAPTGPSAVAA